MDSRKIYAPDIIMNVPCVIIGDYALYMRGYPIVPDKLEILVSDEIANELIVPGFISFRAVKQLPEYEEVFYKSTAYNLITIDEIFVYHAYRLMSIFKLIETDRITIEMESHCKKELAKLIKYNRILNPL